jgi:hypothetical protein
MRFREHVRIEPKALPDAPQEIIARVGKVHHALRLWLTPNDRQIEFPAVECGEPVGAVDVRLQVDAILEAIPIDRIAVLANVVDDGDTDAQEISGIPPTRRLFDGALNFNIENQMCHQA